jgi:lipopolysaccharide biosynthesis glycosyltransferase
MNPLRIFMGWDSREQLAYQVAYNSIKRRSSVPVIIEPLGIERLDRPVERRNGNLWCPISKAPMSTQFAISRFLVPILCQRGWALFVDCDIVCLRDIAELFALADDQYAVMCVKHADIPATNDTKMDGQAQTAYLRKNWSSVVLWNCSHPANLRLTYSMLTSLPGRDLHRFCWLEDNEIGALPWQWNYLVGVNPLPRYYASIYHFTLGGPWLKDWKGGLLDSLWTDERRLLYDDHQEALGGDRSITPKLSV